MAQTITLSLSTNNVIQSHQDTPMVQFCQILATLGNAATEQDKNAASILAKTFEGPVRTLIGKHLDIVEIYTKLHELPIFAQHTLHPKDLHESKKTIWGVCIVFCFMQFRFLTFEFQIFMPFLTGGYDQLLYLSSSLPLPDENTPCAMESLLEQSRDFNLKIATQLSQIANDAYFGWLRDALPFFAQKKSAIWDKHFQGYQKKLLQFVEEKFKKDSSNWTTEELAILKLIPEKIDRILNQHAMSGYPFVPKFDCKVPLLCPDFISELHNELTKYTPAFSLVREILFFLRSLAH